jgi:hypothetical protein
MPDIRTILRSFTPSQALRNARRDVDEHARVVAEIDAILQRLPGAAAEPDEDGPAPNDLEEPRAS